MFLFILEIEYASYNLGIFLCARCSQIHRSLGAHLSKVKHLKLDKFEDSQLRRLVEIGNRKAKSIFEKRVPACYRVPSEKDPQLLIEQWIRAKYERLEFSKSVRPSFTSGKMEGYLMKRGKEDSRFHPRKFVLNESDDTLKYYVKEERSPKAILRISELNLVFAFEKTGVKNCLQISYITSANSTRHLYVYHEDAETIVNWYNAIRCAKLHYFNIAYPSCSENELLPLLTRDFAKEGYLLKTGPRKSDGYKRRWFTLDNRKLMYHDEICDPFPKGEIFLGYHMDGYCVRVGPPEEGFKDQGFSFTILTPERKFNLSASGSRERDEWIANIQKVFERPLTTQDISISARLIRKRTTSIGIFG